jgi:alanyl-tRNA synthetase
MEVGYPGIEKRREEIAQVVLAEEERFDKTLERAMKFAEDIITGLKKQGKHQLPGGDAFRLYDTYGLPEEMLKKLVASRGVTLDEGGFARELELQRKTSRSGSVITESVFVANLVSKFKLKATRFVGDKSCSVKTKVCALFKDDQPAQEAKEKDQIKLALESTPFYGESGGQIGDTGIIKSKSATIEILDTHKIDQVHLHLGKVISGTIKVNDKVEAQINTQRRQDIIRNHSATHLLQAILRKVLGEHVRQSGSWVGPDKLRFDFTHFRALNERQLARIEELVNQQIKQDKESEILQMNFEEAQKAGALAFFGEKYQEKVRVVKIGGISQELCGGTHVSSAGEIGMFKIISESSVASGIRRIEAVTAKQAYEVIQQQKGNLKELAQTFGAGQEDLPERIDALLIKIKQLDKRLENSRLKNFKSRIDRIIGDCEKVAEVKIIVQKIKSTDMKLLRLMVDLLKQKARPCVVVLGSVWQAKVLIVCGLSSELCSQGLDATKIIRAIASDVQGSGGGRADFAQAGGRNVQGLKKALLRAQETIKKELKDNEGN